ncbi:MAG: LamG-like jellyroll fold domain-containing protein, partial [Candidatus Falkowbacteria bacterium]
TLNLSTACDVGQPVINLSWSNAGDNVVRYDIYRGLTAGEADTNLLISFSATTPEATSRTWQDASVVVSTDYYYKIVATGPNGTASGGVLIQAESSVIGPIATLSCAPTAPALFLTTSCVGGNPVIDLSWITNEDNTTRYEIFRDDCHGGTGAMVNITNTSIKNWQDDGNDCALAPNTAYTYDIDAIGYEDTQRSNSGPITIVTYNCAPPGNFTLSTDNSTNRCEGPNNSRYKVDFDWTNSSNSNEYGLFRSGSIISSSTSIYQYTDWGFANALSFDGNDYVICGHDNSLNMGSEVTVEAWIKIDNPNQGRMLIVSKKEHYRAGSDDGNYEFEYDPYYNELRIYGTGDNPAIAGGVNLDTNWHHVAGAIAGTTGRLYLDGVDVTTDSSVSALAIGDNVNVDLTIGRMTPGSNQTYYFNGDIDEVRVYSRALDSSEILQHFQGTYSDESGLAGLWHFDEGSGADVSDSSNYGNNCVITGATWDTHGPQAGSNYDWLSTAYGPGGTTNSNPVNLTATDCAPVKPGLVLTPSCNGVGVPEVDLAWSYSYGATDYELHRVGASSNPIATFNSNNPSDTREFTDSGAEITSSADYTYYVRAINGIGQIDSDQIDITTFLCAAPDQPVNVTASFDCGGTSYPQVNLNWDDATNADYYEIVRGGSALPGVTTGASIYSDIYPSVAVNTAYNYSIRPWAEGGLVGPDSVQVNIAAGQYCDPSIPDIFIASSTCEGGAPVNSFSWSDDTPFNTNFYEIYRDGTTVGDRIYSSADNGERNYRDSDAALADLTSYDYYVKAIGLNGTDSISLVETITTYYCGTPGVPSASEGTHSCLNNAPYAEIVWPDIANALSYNVYRDGNVFPTRISPFRDVGDWALDFSEDNDYVEIPDNSSLNPETITMEAWIYPVNFNNNYGNIISKRNPEQYILRLYNYAGRIQGYTRINGGWHNCVSPSASAINLNQWSHIAYTYNGTAGRVYINGVEENSCSYSGNMDIGNNSLFIGVRENLSENFNGRIDGVRIYGRALEADEIADHYINNYQNEAELRGAWHFDEGFGNAIYDNSGNNNHGTLNNMDANDWINPSGKPGYIPPYPSDGNYDYTVSSVGVNTESAQSAPVGPINITTANCLPADPNLVVTTNCNGQKSELVLTWNASDSNTSYWSIYRTPDPKGIFPISIDSPINTYHNEVSSGVSYDYHIIGYGPGGVEQPGPWTVETETAPICVDAPSTPVITVTAQCFGTGANDSGMVIDWSEDASGNTVSFGVGRMNLTDGEIVYTWFALGLSNSTIYQSDLSLDIGDEYEYIVAADNGASVFAYSNPDSDTALDCPAISPTPAPILSAPVRPDPLRADNIQVALTWTDSGNEEEYDIERDWLGDGVGDYVVTDNLVAGTDYTDGSDVHYIDTTIIDSQSYTYRIRALNNGRAKDAFSNLQTIDLPIAYPGIFAMNAERVVGLNDVNITWAYGNNATTTTAGGNIEYTVVRGDSPSFTLAETLCTITCPDLECTGQVLECYDADPDITKIYYRVRATNVQNLYTDGVDNAVGDVPTWIEVQP